MMDHLNQMDTQESTVKVDLLHLDPTDPDGGCCCGHHSGGHCCGRHRHGQENQPNAEEQEITKASRICQFGKQIVKYAWRTGITRIETWAGAHCSGEQDLHVLRR